MSDLKDLFDSYGRHARLYPAILLVVPLLALPGVFSGVEAFSGYVVGGLVGIAVVYALTHVVRRLGKKAEAKLLAGWGGLPTTQCLLWSDGTLDVTTKQRYYAFLRRQGLEMPMADEERADPAGAREKLTSAVTWLRNNRRDRCHAILHGENASYGFRRNLYGAKLPGIVIALAAFGICVGVALRDGVPTLAIFDQFATSMPVELRAGLFVSLAWSCGWLFWVTPRWVREAADLYAKALLETCDAPAGGPDARSTA